MRNKMPSLPRTRRRSASSSPSTRFSARVPILCTMPMSSSTRPSVISPVRAQHKAASRVRRTCRGRSRRSEGYSWAALARQAPTTGSVASANRSAGRPRDRMRSSLSTSASRLSRLIRPGSALSSPSTPRPPPRTSPSSPRSATSCSRRSAASGASRAAVVAQNRSLAAERAAPMIRSIRPGGSMCSDRQRARRASRSRSSETSSGATSSPSHVVRASSSARVASWKSRA